MTESAPITIDELLSKHTKNLKPGESISIPLYKSRGTISTIDPIQASRAQKAAASVGAKTLTRSFLEKNEMKFPRLMKFNCPVVTKPDWDHNLKDGRLYIEDIPKAKDESDSDEDQSSANPRKRWKKNQPPRQHWVLQTKDEFFKKVLAKQKQKKDPVEGARLEQVLEEKLSERYYGIAEANPSSYIVMGVTNDPSADSDSPSIGMFCSHGYTNFTQPKKYHTLSMQEAEQVLNTKQSLSRYMMHQNGIGSQFGASQQPQSKSFRSRLLEKIQDNDEENDVMTDLCFREAKATKATTELLNDVADGNIKVDAEGVLGGVNDSEFGGRRRFMNVSASKSDNEGKKDRKVQKVQGEGVAMEDDFYQRDVGAEYDELDYDPNEQFDDDDVDVGEADVEDTGGFAADVDEDEEEEDDEDDDAFGALFGNVTDASSGFATTAGLKAMIAKANGEELTPPLPISMKKSVYASGSDGSDDDILGGSSLVGKTDGTTQPTLTSKVKLDEHGLRVITRESVQREIWLHNGSIKSKKLFKVFGMSSKKSSRERKDVFISICKELCTMNDGVLTLKQHYAKMDK